MKGTELADRIRDEMAAAKHDYIDMLGELLTEYLRIHPETEMDGEKSLKGALDALRKTAQKKQKGGCYAMPPKEIFSGMMDYFQLPHTDADFAACMMAMIGQSAADTPEREAETQPQIAPEKSMDDLLDLDALLGV